MWCRLRVDLHRWEGDYLMLLRCLLALLLAALSGCEQPAQNGRSLAEIKKSGTLVVLTRNAPTTWHIGRDGEPAGPEHDLAEAFAAELGVAVEYRQLPTVEAVLVALEHGEGDLAAAGLTVTDARQARFRLGASYQDVTQQVVCRRDRVQPEAVEDLIGLDLRVIAGSSYAERLAVLKEEYPQLSWREIDDADTEALLREVWESKFDCTVADSTIVDINRRYFPELIAPFNLSREQPLAWALPAGAGDLEKAVNRWLRDFEADGRLAVLLERYYGFFEAFDYVDVSVYLRRIEKRFPQYRKYFREAAEEYGLPPLLLAAQGYQESHWDPRASSPTGVRGIMMLTRPTARAMGVENRLDPRQSIFGGARYLARMKERFADAVKEPDRTWLALAAYNIGRAHLHDAQTLARQQGLNPYLWRDIKQVLPLLSQKKHYKKLKYGYARGMEPVRYVQRIREYQHILREQVD